MIENFWPTQIGFYDNPNHKKIEKKLINECLKIKKNTTTGGKKWLSEKTYNTSDGVYDIVTKKNFKEINDFVFKCVENYVKEVGLNININHKDGWFNIYEKGNFQESHTHYTYIISAVYFLKSDVNSSKLFFFSPFKDQLEIK
jgi:hypothetical protein